MGHVEMNRREKIAMLLDLRTLPCSHVSVDIRKSAVCELEEEYVQFGIQCYKYDLKEAMKARDKAATSIEGEATEEHDAMPTRLPRPTRRLGTAVSKMRALECGTQFDPKGEWTSDDEPEDLPCEHILDDDAHWKAKEHDLRDEFKSKFKAWRSFMGTIDWSIVEPKLKARSGAPDLMDLLNVSIGPFYKELEGKEAYGHLPHMASCCIGQLGALNAESFCERVLSCANTVLTDGNTLLSDEEVEMLVVLRMNKSFMEFMRQNYPEVGKQAFKMTVVDI